MKNQDTEEMEQLYLSATAQGLKPPGASWALERTKVS